MGKVTQKIRDVMSLEKPTEILKRYEKVVCAHAIREYLGMKVDSLLTVEIHLLEEEIISRLSKANPLVKHTF